MNQAIKLANKLCPAAMVMALTLLLPSFEAAAQDKSTPSTTKTPTTKPQAGVTKESDDEFERQKLSMPVEFPTLPELPGPKKFIDGTIVPKALHGPSYIINYRVKQTREEVLNFYETAMPGNKWKIKKRMKHMLDAAHPEGHTCMIMVQRLADQPPLKPGKEKLDQTKLSIYFHAFQR